MPSQSPQSSQSSQSLPLSHMPLLALHHCTSTLALPIVLRFVQNTTRRRQSAGASRRLA